MKNGQEVQIQFQIVENAAKKGKNTLRFNYTICANWEFISKKNSFGILRIEFEQQ